MAQSPRGVTTLGLAIQFPDDKKAGGRSMNFGDEVSFARKHADILRAASYTHIARSKESKFAASPLSLPGELFNPSAPPSEDGHDTTPPTSSGWSTPDESIFLAASHSAPQRDLAAELRRSAKIASSSSNDISHDSRSSLESRVNDWSSESSSAVSTAATTPTTHTPRASVNSGASRKAKRRSWNGSSSQSSTSRSPSPEKIPHSGEKQEISGAITVPAPVQPASRRKKSIIRRTGSSTSMKEIEGEGSRVSSNSTASRKSSLLRRGTPSVSGLFRSSASTENAVPHQTKKNVPSVPAIPKSFSTDRLPLNAAVTSPEIPSPRLISSDRAAAGGLILPKKKDPLWSAFRELDGEYAKFASKTLAFKTNVVRSSLLPFLREHAKHPSNWSLRPEDLDRRANILNKWWTGLIELLHGRNNQSIAGTDRPAILDGASGIMDRPEWRLAPSPLSPIAQRTREGPPIRTGTSSSNMSTNSEFLTESVHHNVRNIFIQNLSAQVVFAVDKMSLRNAPVSLVTFCGKACAYAFMFVPGMAEVLVRLWDLPVDPIRRVLQQSGVGKFVDVSDNSSRISAGFPPALQPLGFKSLTKYMKKLRTPPSLPLGTSKVPWWGSWLERWTGRESDLFYVFVKYFHILTTEFLPQDATKEERICAPGFALVQAQILTNLDATIHRQSKNSTPDDSPHLASQTFDDILADPDAIAPTMPVPPINAVRIMAENRLIMLIRDFLSERAADYPAARQLFAESFNDCLQTAACGTSMYDHAACYTLLDFAEEALVLLVRYERLTTVEGSLINGQFWQEVARMIVKSHNTMTEIRLYAFLYTVWSTVICETGWRSRLCLDFLLDPEIFASRFNHWCPMVRAYYMRLLCWRVGRFDGEATLGDLNVFETLYARLQTNWSHYLHLRAQAEQQKTLLPTTNPCNPAPNRRLRIVRTDGHINRRNALLSFDGILPSSRMSSSDTSATSKRTSTASLFEIDVRPGSPRAPSDECESPQTKLPASIGGFFRNFIGSKPRSGATEPLATSSPTADSPLPTHGPAISDPRIPRERASATKSKFVSPPGSAGSAQQPPPPPTLSFKFSLEFQPSAKALPPMRLRPPRLPLPAQQFLHASQSSENNGGSSCITATSQPVAPTGEYTVHARYCGRALAEWNLVLAECQSFFERRKAEGMQENRAVETPSLGIEVFRRPG